MTTKPPKSPVQIAAMAYYKAGLTVIPIRLDGTKAPAVPSWREMQQRPPESVVRDLFADGDKGIAILGGATSGGLEVIDFESEEIFDLWSELIEDIAPGLLARCPQVRTPNGRHVYFRSDAPQGNTVLARSKQALAGKKAATDGSSVSIETRGEGGYVIAPPSPAAVHPTGKLYTHAGGPKISKVERVTVEERTILIDTARGFNEVAERPQQQHAGTSGGSDDATPGGDFNLRGDWASILEPHGWKMIRQRGRVRFWQRPGKEGERGISATSGYCDGVGDGLYVFSSNAHPLEGGRVYTKFTVYGRLEHNGDFRAAARELRKKGYGRKPPPGRADGPPPHDDRDAPPSRHLSVVHDNPQAVTSPRPQDARIDAKALDDLLCNDKGAALIPETFAALVSVRDSDPPEWARCMDVLRQHKQRTPVLEALKAHDRAARLAREKADAIEGVVLVADALADLGKIPVKGDHVVPQGYIVRRAAMGEERLFRVAVRERKDGPVEVEIPVCDRIPLVSSILRHRDGRNFTECVWPRRDGRGWDCRPVPVADAAKLVDACRDHGFPGDSNNRKEMVAWLSAYERTNRDRIEHRMVSDQCGAQEGGGFLLGSRYIGDDNNPVTFYSAGAGESQMMRGFSSAGTFQGWRDAIAVARKFPKIELALYAALAPVLLKALDAPSFAVEWAGATSSGKTTALRLGASVFGRPDADGLIRNWGGTRVGVERYLSTMCDLPTFLDDTQTARRDHKGKSQIVEDVLYQLASGGALRGDKEGTREFLTWRTVLLSTGEQSMSDTVQGGGAAARVITVWGSPFDGVQPEVVSNMVRGLSENYGQAGEVWVRYVIDNEDKWPEWRKMFAETHHRYREQLKKLPDQGVAGRQAGCLAVLGVAATLSHSALELPWSETVDPVGSLVEILGEEIGQISRPRQALEEVASYIGARLAQVRGTEAAEHLESKGRGEPPGGWLGQVTRDSLALYTDQLRSILDGLGFQARGVIRQWGDLGIIARGEDGATRSTVRITRDVNTKAYRISLSRLADAGLDLRGEQADIPF